MKTLRFTSLLMFLFLFVGYTGVAQSQQPTGNQTEDCGCTGGSGFDQERHDAFIESYVPQVYHTNQQVPKEWYSLTSDNTADNKGTNFWLAMQSNNQQTPNLFVDISSDAPASGLVEIPGLAFSQPFNTTPGTIERITLPSGAVVNGSEAVANLGIHITSDVEVTVYGLNLVPFTSDAFLALPVDILNTQYIVASYPKTTRGGWGQSQFIVVSPYDDNIITITPSAQTALGKPANTPFQVTLNEGEVYQVQGTTIGGNDLTGSLIQSTLPVAVFAGNECADIPWNSGDCCCDHVVEQLTPVSTWGNSFVTQPLETRSNGDLFRVVASGDNTEVFVNGVSVATLNFAEFYEDVLVDASFIEATKPVLVMQFSMSDEWDPGVNSDPFMMLIPPYEQFFNSYTFATPSEGFAFNFVNLTVENEGVDFHFLDNVPVDPSNFAAIPGSNFSGTGIGIDIGTHSSYNSNGNTFGLYSYGFNNFDSYGYPGGLSLEFINTGGAPVINLTAATISLIANSQPANVMLNISALITDNEEPFVQSASLFYRQVGGGMYTEVPMSEGADNVWSGDIPAPDVNFPGIEFYISATDGQLTTTNPGVNPTNNPLAIAVGNEPPVITHTPVEFANIGEDILISADVVDNTDNVDAVELKFRRTGGNPVYTTVMMMNVGGDTYEGTIPGAEMTDAGVDYYIRAVDNYGIAATSASADDPYQIMPFEGNIPPVPSGFPGSMPTIIVGETYNLSVQFASPEGDQTTDVVLNGLPLPGVSAVVTPGNIATVDLEIVGGLDNLGMHSIDFEATDDGVPAETTVVTFSFEVVEQPTGQEICIPEGWSIISSYLDPANPSPMDIFEPLTTEDKLIIAVGEDGFYWPSQNVSTWDAWNVYHAYKVKLSEPGCLTIDGMMPDDKTVELNQGANLMPVLCDMPVASGDIFSQLGGDLLFAFDLNTQDVYWPGGGLFTLDVLVPGKGYIVSMLNPGSATYDCNMKSSPQGNIAQADPLMDPNAPWSVQKSNTMHLISIDKTALDGIGAGDYIGAFNSEGVCAGFVKVENTSNNLLLAAYGVDFTAEQAGGLSVGEQISFKVYKASAQTEVPVNAIFDNGFANSDLFAEYGQSKINNLTMSVTGISQHSALSQVSISPNPSNGVFNLEIPAIDDELSIEVMNISGQVLVNKRIASGQDQVSTQLDLRSLNKGVYFVKFISNGATIIKKVIIQ